MQLSSCIFNQEEMSQINLPVSRVCSQSRWREGRFEQYLIQEPIVSPRVHSPGSLDVCRCLSAISWWTGITKQKINGANCTLQVRSMTDNDIARTFSYTSSVNVERINGWRRFGIFAVYKVRSTVKLIVNLKELRPSNIVRFQLATRVDGFPDTRAFSNLFCEILK